jgi:DNA-binding GntR family transcriptional regulator
MAEQGAVQTNAAIAAKRLPHAHVVAEALRRAILAGRYGPGERLVEDRLAAEYGGSRVPVREALKTLAGEGLVEVAPHRGACVADLSQGLIEELVEVRATLEGLNARLAARRRDPAILPLLRDVLERGNRAAAHATPAELAALNSEFHELLARAGSNRILQDIMRTLRERTDLAFRRNSTARAPDDWREHAMILAAVVDGDEELATLMATRHVRTAAQALSLLEPDAKPPSK